jgi:hypothetical protein
MLGERMIEYDLRPDLFPYASLRMLSREKLKTERNFDFVTQSKKKQRYERRRFDIGIC